MLKASAAGWGWHRLVSYLFIFLSYIFTHLEFSCSEKQIKVMQVRESNLGRRKKKRGWTSTGYLLDHLSLSHLYHTYKYIIHLWIYIIYIYIWIYIIYIQRWKHKPLWENISGRGIEKWDVFFLLSHFNLASLRQNNPFVICYALKLIPCKTTGNN